MNFNEKIEAARAALKKLIAKKEFSDFCQRRKLRRTTVLMFANGHVNQPLASTFESIWQALESEKLV